MRKVVKNETEFQPLRVLIIEDHQDLAENIGDYLEARGHIVDFALDGIGGIHLALTQSYDILILDIMLPGMDGLTLCRRLREEAETHIPVLMLTARDTLEDKLEGFDSGADDYLVKPFALEELAARLNALARRTAPSPSARLCVGDLEMDTGTLKVTRAKRPIRLNRACFRILKMLMTAYPKVVTRREIEYALWGDMPPGSDALRSHMYALRQEIDKPFPHPMIETLRGVGYRLVGKDET